MLIKVALLLRYFKIWQNSVWNPFRIFQWLNWHFQYYRPRYINDKYLWSLNFLNSVKTFRENSNKAYGPSFMDVPDYDGYLWQLPLISFSYCCKEKGFSRFMWIKNCTQSYRPKGNHHATLTFSWSRINASGNFCLRRCNYPDLHQVEGRKRLLHNSFDNLYNGNVRRIKDITIWKIIVVFALDVTANGIRSNAWWINQT